MSALTRCAKSRMASPTCALVCSQRWRGSAAAARPGRCTRSSDVTGRKGPGVTSGQSTLHAASTSSTAGMPDLQGAGIEHVSRRSHHAAPHAPCGRFFLEIVFCRMLIGLVSDAVPAGSPLQVLPVLPLVRPRPKPDRLLRARCHGTATPASLWDHSSRIIRLYAHPTRAPTVWHVLPEAHAALVLIGGCNPTLCPIRGTRSRRWLGCRADPRPSRSGSACAPSTFGSPSVRSRPWESRLIGTAVTSARAVS